MAEGQVSAGADLSRIIYALGKDTSEISLADLAELIEQDSQILSRIISTANTLGYNPGNTRITSAAGAIHVVGFNRIRSLALSLTLMEHAGRTHGGSAHAEMAALSLCSGLVAQASANEGALLDPDLAFVCGSLRNFGRLLLSTLAAEDLKKTQEEFVEGGEDEAYRRNFGLTPLELGYELLRAQSLPEVVLHAVRDVPASALSALPWIDRQYLQLARFSLEFAETALDSTLSAAAFPDRIKTITARYQRDLPQLKDALPSILEYTENRLLQFAKAGSAGGQNNLGLHRFRARRKGRDLAPPLDLTAGPCGVVAPGPSMPIADALDEIGDVPHVSAAVPMVLGAMHYTLRCQHILYCPQQSTAGDFRLSHGRSALTNRLAGRRLCSRHDRDIIYLCRTRLENIVIRDATAEQIRPHLPHWLKSADAPKSFTIFPVHQAGQMEAFIIVGWDSTTALSMDPENLRVIRLLLTQVAELNARHRSSKDAPPDPPLAEFTASPFPSAHA